MTAASASQGASSPETGLVGISILDFQPPELWKPCSLQDFATAAEPTKTVVWGGGAAQTRAPATPLRTLAGQPETSFREGRGLWLRSGVQEVLAEEAP